MTDIERYPLSWPVGWRRCPRGERRFSRFTRKNGDGFAVGLSISGATARLLDELRRLGVSAGDCILSTNVRTRLDGLPYSGEREPDDPGAAVYFRLRGKDRVLACDSYSKVAGNVAAIAAHVEALRAIERYGVGSVDQAFAGYTALPASAEEEWWLVLGVRRSAPLDEVVARYRELAQLHHPDRGGSDARMARINVAADRARLEKS